MTSLERHRQISRLSDDFYRLTTKKTSKLRITDPLWAESTSGQWPHAPMVTVDSHHRGSVVQKAFHDVIISEVEFMCWLPIFIIVDIIHELKCYHRIHWVNENKKQHTCVPLFEFLLWENDKLEKVFRGSHLASLSLLSTSVTWLIEMA